MEIIFLSVAGIFISWLYLTRAPMIDIKMAIYNADNVNAALQNAKAENDKRN
jgi:hypothetical protein